MRGMELTGKKFNRLTVIERNGKKNGSITWLCKCECGNHTTTTSNYLTSGHTKSCGCLVIEKISKLRKRNHIGRKNGKLEVIKELGENKILVRCECGTEKEIILSNLPKTHSCGCIRGGHPHSKLKGVWESAKQRCNNPNHKFYNRYGGRGIEFSQSWSDYVVFKEWAESNGYQEGVGLTLDRIDNNLGYSPDNCRWVDMKTQIRNRRNTFHVDFKGEKVTLGFLSDQYGINIRTLKSRYQRGIRGMELVEEVKKRGNK